MLELLARVLPLAVASAMSPVILGIAVALLSGKKGSNAGASAFLAGGVVVAAALAILGFAAGNGFLSSFGIRHLPASLDIGLGVLLVAFAAKTLLEKEEGDGKKIGQSGGGPMKWFAIGFLANATNADAVVLNFTAVREIFREGANSIYEISLLALADFFFLAPALVPLLIYMIAPEKTSRYLAPIGAWMKRYGKFVVASIFLIFGMYLLRKGLGMG